MAPRPAPADDCVDRLRAMIVQGTFMPNERLVELDLAAALGTSRMTVRQAITRLRHEGLVVCEKNRGARVRLYTDTEIIQITEARAALECLAVRHAATRAIQQDVELLSGIVREMSASAQASDLVEYSHANGRFHAQLLRVADNATIAALLQSLRYQSIRFQHRGVMVPGRVSRSLEEHRAILAALAKADADTAEREMRHHLANVIDALRQAMSYKLHLLSS